MPESPNPEPGFDEDQPAEQRNEPTEDYPEKDEPETWRPGQGRWFRTIVWSLVLLMLLCLAAAIVLIWGSVGKAAP